MNIFGNACTCSVKKSLQDLTIIISISDEVEDHPATILFSLGFMSTYCSWSCAYRHRQDKSKKCSACGQCKDRTTSKWNDKDNLVARTLTKLLQIFISYKIGHLEPISEIALKRVFDKHMLFNSSQCLFNIVSILDSA